MITGFAIIRTNGSTEFGIIKTPDYTDSNDVQVYVNKWVYHKDEETIQILSVEEVLKQYDDVAYLTHCE